MSHEGRRTPFEIYKSILRTLDTNTDRIKLVKRDQELILDDWEIYFAVDPYDISEFCFPFTHIDTLNSMRPLKIDEISNLQNGRYEVLYNVEDNPILLEPYEKELKDILKWARWSKFIAQDSNLIDKYLAEFEIKSATEWNETKEILSELTDKDISSVIAVATGIVSLGFTRLYEVVYHQLDLEIPAKLRGQQRPVLEARREVIDIVLSGFKEYFEDYSPRYYEGADSPALQRSQRLIDANNRRDAIAVDQILQLNQFYNKDKKLFLYFSSSPKSLFIDKRKETLLKDYYPIIDGTPYDLVRTANDLFVYMVCKGDSPDLYKRSSEAREKLQELEGLIENIEDIRDAFKTASENCLHCNWDLEQRCEYGTLCDGIIKCGELIRRKQNLNVNYVLQKRLAEILEENKDRSLSEKYTEILKYIADILKDKKIRAKSQELEVTTLQSLIIKAEFVSSVVAPELKDRDPKVSCYLNYYPVCLNLQNRELAEIAGNIVELVKSSWDEKSFFYWINKYIVLDAPWNEDSESELVRCFLYLILGETRKAKRAAERYLNDALLPDSILREFRYLLCFILWKEKKYRAAVTLATDSLEQYGHDGRFFHVRSVINLSWLNYQDNAASYDYSPVVEDTYKAIERFSRKESLLKMLGVCYNNLAYYLSEPAFRMVNVPQAEDFLRKLTWIIPEGEWNPSYPEFFHTKGCVLNARYVDSYLGKKSEVLDEAYRMAKTALKLYRKKEHEDLVEMIENTYWNSLKTSPPKV